jgi:hypothetical protein
MRRLSSSLAAVAALLLAACAAPTTTTGQTASVTHQGYQEPDTGSLFGGNPHPDVSSGVYDPSMGNVQQSAGGK